MLHGTEYRAACKSRVERRCQYGSHAQCVGEGGTADENFSSAEAPRKDY